MTQRDKREHHRELALKHPYLWHSSEGTELGRERTTGGEGSWLLEGEICLSLKRRHCFLRQPRGKLVTEVHRILIFLSVGCIPWLPTG